MTKTNFPQQQLDSTSLAPMEALSHHDDVMALGRKLVDELQMGPTDTLGRWMAHYVAELIDAVSTGPSAERPTVQERCFNAIVELWKYRAELPDGKRPFADLEPVVRAIESLDPEKKETRYYGESDASGKSGTLLRFVSNLDASARTLIRLCLGEAAEEGAGKASEWLAAAEAAGLDTGVHEIAMRFLAGIQGEASHNLDPSLRKILVDRIKRLDAFARVARLVSDELRSRLGATQVNDLENEDAGGEDAGGEDAEGEDAEGEDAEGEDAGGEGEDAEGEGEDAEGEDAG